MEFYDDFYEHLILEINSAESYLEDAEEENWEGKNEAVDEKIQLQRNYLDALIEVQRLAKKIYDIY